MDLQDVPHLFDCTTHQTDLSPEDLWRNPVRFVRLAISTTETLTDLKTDLVVANNNNRTILTHCVVITDVGGLGFYG